MLDFTGISKEQEEAVRHRGEHLLVLAGPGSGKTFTLLCRLQYLIEDCGVPPEKILVITFTKAAVQSMEKRFLVNTSQHNYPVTFTTFHSFFYRILKPVFGLRPDCFISETEKQDLLIPVLNQFQNREAPEIWLERFSKYRNTFEEPPGVEAFHEIYSAYDKRRKKCSRIDYDDMAVQCRELFLTSPDILKQWQNRYRYILIDEFQDINRCQYEIVYLLAGEEQEIFAVGDDDQSIYGFRGSDPSLMKQFCVDFRPVKRMLLVKNYRSTGEIVSMSRKVIDENKARVSKELVSAKDGGDGESFRILSFPDEKEEYDFLSEEIRKYRKEDRTGKEKIAVILRTNAAVCEVTKQLKIRNIFCRQKKKRKRFYDHFIVRDILSYLQFATGNRERKYFLHFCNIPDRGIRREYLLSDKISFEELLKNEELTSDEKEKVRELERDLSVISGLPPFLAVNYIRKKMGYDHFLSGKASVYRENIDKYIKIADRVQEISKNFRKPEDMLSGMEKACEECDKIRDEDPEWENPVYVMTMHMSKGLEFDRVFLPDCNEGKIPGGKNLSPENLEEERRLFYVGMTRAKKTLDIIYLTGTKQYPGFPSSFLNPVLEKKQVIPPLFPHRG